MKTNYRNTPAPKSSRWATLYAFSVGMLAASPVWAGFAIPDAPLQTGSRVPANVMLILDDSGSMASEFMPDNVPNINTTNNFRNQVYTRNTIYFNPTVDYNPWMTETGARKADTPYTAVWSDDAFLTSPITLLAGTGGNYDQVSVTGTTDRVFYYPKVGITNIADGTQYYRYLLKADGTVARQEWIAGAWSVAVDQTTFPWGGDVASLRQNFATWYSFHRTRTKIAKAGVSEAFSDLGEDIRVGYNTIWNVNKLDIPVGTDDGLFRGANRTNWYTRLQAANASGTTPLRASLTRTGNYYSDASATGPNGPQATGAQLTCRQNFTLMTTDGFWNEGGFADGTNHDGAAGPTHTNPKGATYTYTPAPPYSDVSTSTLADVAMKYWKNDLRTDLENNVPTTTADPAFWQHMVTFAISIGVQGTPALFNDIPGIYAGTRPWTVPVNNTITALDDLFHASINGHGEFIVANDPQEMTAAVKAALSAITDRVGSSSNVSANSVSVGAGTRIFQASYFTGQWTGEIAAKEIVNNQVVDAPKWRASENIPTFASGNRKIWTSDAGTGVLFPNATQLAILTTDIADYIKGDRSKELSNGGTFRNRVNLLGDIVNSSPAYVKGTLANEGMLYVGANDGMMHAFSILVDPDPDGNPLTDDSVTTGTEVFAYVPGNLDMSNLKTLADDPYDHKYFVDGPVTVTTRTDTPNKNILVGSLGRGGKGLYALDVSNPTAFTAANALWEADETRTDGSETLIGNVISRPIITKANNGEMVVIVSNGLNSTDDRPALLVYELYTGVLRAKITPNNSTGVVAIGNNGLSAVTGVDADGNKTIDYAYAGDMQGNLWKFDLRSITAGSWLVGNGGKPLFIAKDSIGNSQAISGGTAIGFDDNLRPFIVFGTGRYLTAGDPATTSVQTWYGVVDDNSNTIKYRADLKERKIVGHGLLDNKLVRAFEPTVSGDMIGKKGWFIDLVNDPYSNAEKLGERIVGTPIVRGTSVFVSSIIPNEDPCLSVGSGYINGVDLLTGSRGLEGADGFFDVNGSGSFSDDKITDVNGKQVSVGSIDLGIFMPTDGLILSGNTNEVFLAGGSQGGTGSTPTNVTRVIGRISWHEMNNN